MIDDDVRWVMKRLRDSFLCSQELVSKVKPILIQGILSQFPQEYRPYLYQVLWKNQIYYDDLPKNILNAMMEPVDDWYHQFYLALLQKYHLPVDEFHQQMFQNPLCYRVFLKKDFSGIELMDSYALMRILHLFGYSCENSSFQEYVLYHHLDRIVSFYGELEKLREQFLEKKIEFKQKHEFVFLEVSKYEQFCNQKYKEYGKKILELLHPYGIIDEHDQKLYQSGDFDMRHYHLYRFFNEYLEMNSWLEQVIDDSLIENQLLTLSQQYIVEVLGCFPFAKAVLQGENFSLEMKAMILKELYLQESYGAFVPKEGKGLIQMRSASISLEGLPLFFLLLHEFIHSIVDHSFLELGIVNEAIVQYFTYQVYEDVKEEIEKKTGIKEVVSATNYDRLFPYLIDILEDSDLYLMLVRGDYASYVDQKGSIVQEYFDYINDHQLDMMYGDGSLEMMERCTSYQKQLHTCRKDKNVL